jgi:aminomethyltransferase
MADVPEALKTVVLNDKHLALGGRMVPFSGYSLPVQYPAGIMAEHKWTREHAGLFDVSHMGPSFLVLDQRTGDAEADHAAVAAVVEPLVCGDIRGLKPGQIRYTLLLNEAGGTLDDLMIARPAGEGWGGALYIVVNAGCKDADFAAHRRSTAPATLRGSEPMFSRGLLALQGPQARRCSIAAWSRSVATMKLHDTTPMS